jgi:hypothetical protein
MILAAGLLYGLLIFVLGFFFGVVREMALAPMMGRSAVVMIEAPLILICAWLLAWRLIRWRGVPAAWGPRLVMGATGFALLMLGELGVSVFGYGLSPARHFAAYAHWRGFLELSPQIAFGLIPALHLVRERLLR